MNVDITACMGVVDRTDVTDGFRLFGEESPEDFRIAAICVHDANGRYLLQLRDDFPEVAAGGKWGFFGGRVEGGETLPQAAIREFFEETGITLSPGDIAPLARFSTDTFSGGMIYVFGTERTIAPHDICLSEGAGFGYLSVQQIAKFDVIGNVRGMILGLAGIALNID